MLGTTIIAVIIKFCAALNVKLRKNYLSIKEHLNNVNQGQDGMVDREQASEYYEEVDITLRASTNTVIDMIDNAAYSTAKEKGLNY